MTRDLDRLDGWKAIGGHFGRDRTTVIRWHKHRGLPVRSLPGGKTKTIYAFKTELDAWTATIGTLQLEPNSTHEEPLHPASVEIGLPTLVNLMPPAPRRWRPRYLAGLGARGVAGLVMLVVAGATLLAALDGRAHAPPPALQLPRNPEVARLFVQATDDLARRNAPSIATSTREFDEVAKRDPGFAPAYSGLASAYILEREFGSLNDPTAFRAARAVALKAQKLDPDLASAYRALGFIAYWWDHDRAAAADGFQSALRLDDNDALTHLWYANALADNGEPAAAAREFAAARLMDPGSLATNVDQAWASWSAGRDDLAARQLGEIISERPNLATAHDCLSMLYLTRLDLAGYAREIAIRATLRGEAHLTAYSDALSTALKRNDLAAVATAMATRARSIEEGAPRSDLALNAFFMSALGDRRKLLQVLTLADRRQEIWGAAGFRWHIQRRWQNDSDVMALLLRRAPPLMEPHPI